MRKKVFAIVMCCVLLLALMSQLSVGVFAATTINSISLSIAYPEAGKAFPEASWHSQGYSVYQTEWYDRDDDRFLEFGEKAQVGHSYEVTIWVEADSGYTFNAVNDNTPSVSATVNGESIQAQKAYEYKAWAMVTVTYSFPPVPANGWIQSVNLTIPAPATGEKPCFDKISTGTYSLDNVYFSGQTNENMKNGIAWYETDTHEYISPTSSQSFAANTGYSFHCLVLPNEGYRITRDARVYVNGQLARSKLDYDSFLSVTYDFPATGDVPCTHTPSEWRTTGAYHYTACTTCGEFLDQEDHYGGVATCEKDGVCTACGYPYLKASEDLHIPDTSKWVPRGNMYHFHKCIVCGAHCDIEDHKWSPKPHVADANGHAYQCADCKVCDEQLPHNPGPAATETTAQTCKDCGYIITPAIGHQHQLTKVEAVAATCTEDGSIEYYSCSGCSDKFADAEGKNKLAEDVTLTVAALGHTQSDKWEYNETEHWKICANCQQSLVETKMEHDLTDGKCSVCGLGEATQPSEAQPTEPQPTEPVSDDAPSGNMDWVLPVVIGLVAFAGAIVATVLILKRKH